MKVLLLGTGNPVPSIRRASAGYLIRVNDDVIVIDHGPGAHWRMLQSGTRALDVSHVIFSHLHYDHCADFVRLFLNRWDQGAGKARPLRIFGPPGLQHFVDRLFGADGAFKFDLTARTNHPESLEVYRERGGVGPRAWPDTTAHEIHDADTVVGDGWRLTAREIPHHQPLLTCFGFRLEADSKVFTFSGDLIHPFDLDDEGQPVYRLHGDPSLHDHYKPLISLMRDSDLHVQYLHLPNAASLVGEPKLLPKRLEGNVADEMHTLIAKFAEENGVKKMVTTHINPLLDRPEIRERVVAEMARIYTRSLVWGEDLMEFEIL